MKTFTMTEDVIRLLKSRGQTVATAESCTGGRLAAALTATAGASGYFRGGVVSYSNDVKIDVLGVSRETLEQHGAVSKAVARQMATGVRRLTGADWAVATTGIAGPGGGSAEKPVGTLWVAVAGPARWCNGEPAGGSDDLGGCEGVVVREARLSGATRLDNMLQATRFALDFLRDTIVPPDPCSFGGMWRGDYIRRITKNRIMHAKER
jgi:PncC family amidohydrolase